MERVSAWVDEAEAKLSGTGVRVFVSGANDDFFEVDDALARSDLIEDPNGTVIELEGRFLDSWEWATATSRPGPARATSPRRS